MAYDSINKKLSTEGGGITLWEVAQCLGDYRVNAAGRRDVGLLCTSPKINKWAKRKPIDYPSLGPLTDEQYRGTTDQHNDNVYFGIKISANVTASLTNETAAEIHVATFEYTARPAGGATSFFRLLDFDGYNHKASPNPGALWPDGTDNPSLTGDWNDEADAGGSLQGIYVGYTPGSDGVDLSAMLLDPSVELDYVLARAYPCILVTDSSGQSWFTALYNAQQGGYVPLLYNGEYQSYGDWRVKFRKPQYNQQVATGTVYPWTSDEDNLKASIFLFRSASDTAPMLTSAAGDFGENWIKLNTTGLVGSSAKPAIIPGALNASLRLRNIMVKFTGATAGATAVPSARTVTIVVTLQEITEYDSENKVTIDTYVYFNGSSLNIPTNGHMEFDGWKHGVSALPVISPQGVLTGYAAQDGESYTWRIRVVTTDGSKTNIYEDSGTGVFNL